MHTAITYRRNCGHTICLIDFTGLEYQLNEVSGRLKCYIFLNLFKQRVINCILYLGGCSLFGPSRPKPTGSDRAFSSSSTSNSSSIFPYKKL